MISEIFKFYLEQAWKGSAYKTCIESRGKDNFWTKCSLRKNLMKQTDQIYNFWTKCSLRKILWSKLTKTPHQIFPKESFSHICKFTRILCEFQLSNYIHSKFYTSRYISVFIRIFLSQSLDSKEHVWNQMFPKEKIIEVNWPRHHTKCSPKSNFYVIKWPRPSTQSLETCIDEMHV